MNWADFIQTDANSGKLKITSIICGRSGSEMGMKFLKEWINEFSWFFACLYILRKVKNYLNSYWVGMVKYVCGLLGHGTCIWRMD